MPAAAALDAASWKVRLAELLPNSIETYLLSTDKNPRSNPELDDASRVTIYFTDYND
jgi:hypothetical protein